MYTGLVCGGPLDGEMRAALTRAFTVFVRPPVQLSISSVARPNIITPSEIRYLYDDDRREWRPE